MTQKKDNFAHSSRMKSVFILFMLFEHYVAKSSKCFFFIIFIVAVNFIILAKLIKIR